MTSVVFLIALTLFYEDRTGDVTSHWAIGNTVINRAEHIKWPPTVRRVLSQPNQFPWFKDKLCRRTWTKRDSLFWSIALKHSTQIIASRPFNRHNLCYFQDKHNRPSWARHLRMVRYGPHVYYECDKRRRRK